MIICPQHYRTYNLRSIKTAPKIVVHLRGFFIAMKYNINFNQKAVIDNNWDCLTANHMVVLDCIVGSINSRKLITIIENGETWYWLTFSAILKQAPILRIKERRCRDIVKDLYDCGLIDPHPENKKHNKHYIKLGTNYHKLIYVDGLQNNANVPPEDMQNNAKGYAENCKPPMQNNAHYNSINYNNTNIIKKEKENASLVLFESAFQIYKKSTSVGSHKKIAFDEFKKLDEPKQQKVFEYIKEYFRRRQILISQGVKVLSLPAMHRFIKSEYWENVDLPKLEPTKQTAIPKFL